MFVWILAVLELFFIQSLLAPAARWIFSGRPQIGLAFGPRDTPPPMPVWGGRLERAFKNMIEAMFIFLPLALLAEFRGLHDGLAVAGSATFLIARIVYVPAYVSGIPGLRSLIWTAGHIGLAMLGFALVQSYLG